MTRFRIRPAAPRDAGACAAILSEWIAYTPWFPTPAPASASVTALRDLIDHAQVWVAQARVILRAGPVLGFIAVQDAWISGLYVRRAAQRQGIGQALLYQARAQHPQGVALASFQANADAIGFYHAQGCIETGRTAGENEENLPDIRFSCPGARL